ncbi:lipopolysaccharide kinase InaA family protein [bacterium]|nr:lipopolysaccharide kinase InaA family protein [bacterium]MBU1959028.1 lipopolysaccharide kinase InaA family protein [bacterium]
MKYKINPKYKEKFTPFLKNIKEHFSNNDQSIHKARNELKIIQHNEINTVVKAFKVPNIINQFAYAYLRGSKAKKSYENGMKLIELGVETPEPIGYIEFYEKGLLKESFFISLHQPYDFLIREPLYEVDFEDRENIIEQFATFTYGLHQKNIFHKDYSAGNTLVIPQNNGQYNFSIVDINRMQFRPIDLDLAMQNFNKLWANESTLTIIAKAYAKLAQVDETKAIKLIIKHDQALKTFVERRRTIKAFFKGKKQ